MGYITVRVRRNADDTMTVRVGRAVEHISITGKSKSELFDALKYACISKGVRLPDVELVEIMQEGMGD